MQLVTFFTLLVSLQKRMSRLNHQHALYARRCEQELNRVQAKNEVNRYYDRWGQVTSRFENWTNKEYYEKADKQLQHKKSQQQKEHELTVRREKMRQLFDGDSQVYNLELGQRRRGVPQGDLQTLERINRSLKEQEQLKRKLEMEAKLYGRWRHGVDDDQLLYKSKSDNEVLAKLNWLDKQIEQQKAREEQEALKAERELQLQQEICRTEVAQKEREQIREQEIKEICSLQETHVAELKQRQEQADKLKEEEQHFRLFLSELEKEKQLLEESTSLMLQRPDISNAFNLKKIKIVIRNRSDAYRKQVELCVDMLERMSKYAAKSEEVQQQLDKCREQLEVEHLASSQVDAMYESEAKSQLERCEDTWREDHLLRFSNINALIEQEQQLLSSMLRENVEEQQQLVELRATHLSGIEQTNKQLDQLNKEEIPLSPREHDSVADDGAVSELSAPAVSCSVSASASASASASGQQQLEENESNEQLSKVTDSFTNLNMDVWQDMPPVRGGADSPRLSKTRSMNVVNPQTCGPPKFARKRVAWT